MKCLFLSLLLWSAPYEPNDAYSYDMGPVAGPWVDPMNIQKEDGSPARCNSWGASDLLVARDFGMDLAPGYYDVKVTVVARHASINENNGSGYAMRLHPMSALGIYWDEDYFVTSSTYQTFESQTISQVHSSVLNDPDFYVTLQSAADDYDYGSNLVFVDMITISVE